MILITLLWLEFVSVNSYLLFSLSGWYTPIVGLFVSLLLYAWACLLSLSSGDKNVILWYFY